MAMAQMLKTTEQLLALPEDGTDRWLIAGELRERPMTRRNRFHSRVNVRVGQLLRNWLDTQPEPRGQILGGEAGVILARDPDTTVGIDVTYISAETIQRQTEESTLIDGIPVLVVEILSPNDSMEEVEEKIDVYLTFNVPLVWIVNPHRRTVTVYQPGREPVLYTVRDDLPGEPHLPGFRIPVARLFD
jgi:Uma2 family endonuclease